MAKNYMDTYETYERIANSLKQAYGKINKEYLDIEIDDDLLSQIKVGTSLRKCLRAIDDCLGEIYVLERKDTSKILSETSAKPLNGRKTTARKPAVRKTVRR